jgi:XTP/dITP diphosphohydrolase
VNQFILASGNAHKAEEFAELFDPKQIVVSAAPGKLEVIEDGKTYNQNALLKAEAYYKKFKKPVLADDSGLTVNALPGELAVQSARFGGDGLSDRQRAELLLRRLSERPEATREAYFTCVLCFYLGPQELYFFEGRVDGVIGQTYKGEHGFGYDPVFLPRHSPVAGATFAEIPEWKQEHSHRAQAVKHAQRFFAGQNVANTLR